MSSRFVKRSMAAVAVGGICLLLIGGASYAVGIRVNTTKSIPVGLYWATDAPVIKGAYVMFCPPRTAVFDEAKQRGYIGAGFCPGGYGYMMKRVMGDGGDAIRVTPEGVLVNGQILALSAPYSTDKAGKLLPRWADQYTLGSTELLLMSDVSGTSFDARYFGPIDTQQVKGVIRPIITW